MLQFSVCSGRSTGWALWSAVLWAPCCTTSCSFHACAVCPTDWPCSRATGLPRPMPSRSPEGNRLSSKHKPYKHCQETLDPWSNTPHFTHLIFTHLQHTNKVCHRENHTHFQRQSRHYNPFPRTKNEGKKRTSCWGLRSVPPGIGSEIRWLTPLRGTSVISSLLRVNYARSGLLHAFQFHRV